MPLVDSLDKVIGHHVAAFASGPFSFGGEVQLPMPITVKADVRRGYTCPSGCGGCCRNWTLDWLPSETMPADDIPTRMVTVNDVTKPVHTIMPKPGGIGLPCRNLRPEDGRCMIHKARPFSCDFELCRVTKTPNRWTVTTRLFSRGPMMNRTDGGRGSLCEMLPVTAEHAADTVRKFRALLGWSDYFQVPSRLPEVIAWMEACGTDEDAPDLHLVPFGEEPLVLFGAIA